MAARKRVPLHLSGGEGVAYRAWPVTQGIPFKDGELERGTPVRVVDQRGRARPTQAQCLATWDRDLKYVRWLLVDFQADLPADERPELFLEYGADAEPPPPDMAVAVTPVAYHYLHQVPDYERDGQGTHVVVDTGVMRVKFRNTVCNGAFPPAPQDRDFFDSLTVRAGGEWRELLQGAPGPHLYMRDRHGNRYDSCSAAPRPAVVVEEAGPLRSVICVRGHHAMSAGGRFCPYILRFHFFAGRSDIRLFHTFVFDQDPHVVELAAVGLRWPLFLGTDPRMAVGGEGRVYTANNARALGLLQSSDEAFTVSRDGVAAGEGRRSAGWCRLQGARGAAVAVLRYPWQEFPKALSLDRDGLDIEVWPAGAAQTLRFTTPFDEPAIYFNGTRSEEEVCRLLAERPTAPLNLKSFNVATREDFLWVEKMIATHASERAASYNDTGILNGTGAAKTTEMHLAFSAHDMDDAEAQQLCAAVQEPLLAPAGPAHICATGAMSHMPYPAGDPRFEAEDASMDDRFRVRTVGPIEGLRLYGMMRYGNMLCGHSAAYTLYELCKDFAPMRQTLARHVGVFNNEGNDDIAWVWHFFLRTGRRDHFLTAQRYSRSVADVAFIHAHPTCPEWVGLMHYHSAHPWSGGPSPSHSLVKGLLMDYYLTGNRRVLEVAREQADWAVRQQEPCGIVSVRYPDSLTREFMGPVLNLFEVYQATWEEKYGDLARRSMNWFLRAVPAPGQYPSTLCTRGERGDEAVTGPVQVMLGHSRDASSLLAIALRHNNSRTLREFIVAEADHYVRNMLALEGADHNLRVVALAYDLTGDPVHAAFARRHADPFLLRIVADAMGKAPDGLDAVECARQQEIETKPAVEIPERWLYEPRRDLGRLSTEALP